MILLMLRHSVRHFLKAGSIVYNKLFNLARHSAQLLVVLFFLLLVIVLIVNYYERKIVTIYDKNRLKFYHLNPDQGNPIAGPTNDTIIPHDLVVIYNRVPKTGSTSFMGIAYELHSRNGFNVMHLNTTKNSHVMSLSDQLRFVWNVTHWTKKQPSLIHGHIGFLNFGRFGLLNIKPVYINIIRRPLDRLVSYYYFLRNGDNFRPNIVRKKQGDKQTFDECVDLNERDCRVENLWLQIPFFCGQSSECWKPGNKWALDQAKRNLINHYFLVGVTESMHDFIQVLEAALPQMFNGASAIFEKGTKSHLRKTFNKVRPSSKTIAKIQQSRIWQMENEFYQFALDNFNFIKDKTLIKVSGNKAVDRGQQFFFEKIRPK